MARQKSRWWKIALGVTLAVALLAGAAEFALRLIIPGIIQETIRDEFSLTEDHPVEVSLGGSALGYALTGTVGDVTVEVPNAPVFAGIEVDAVVHADRLPFDPTTGELTGGTASLQVPRDQVGNVIALATQGLADTGSVENGTLVVGRTIDLFGQTIDLSAGIGLSVIDGAVQIEPREVRAAGLDLSAEQISAATGNLLDPILSPQVVCVADRLPQGITLTNIMLSSTGAVQLDAVLAPGLLSDPTQQELGSCG